MNRHLALIFVILTCGIALHAEAYYVVYVKTSDDWFSGTDAHVDIKLYGHLRESGTDWINLNTRNHNDFERGSTDAFYIAEDYGIIFNIELRHDDAHAGADWKLETVIVMDYKRSHTQYQFHCDCWIEEPNPYKILRRSVNGGWTSFGGYTRCSTTCGTGRQTKQRSCTNPKPYNGGAHCSGHSIETKSCFTKNCPVDGGWSAWSDWPSCTVHCGGGTQTRVRSCTNPRPAYDGSTCPGSDKESRDCNTHNCSVDGGWTDWSHWSDCSTSCGNGNESSSRTCTNPAPAHGGQGCVGNETRIRKCKLEECPVNGGWSHWSDWGPCSISCGEGTQTSSRNCSNPSPTNSGLDCVGNSTRTISCKLSECPIDGVWTAWSEWSSCSQKCGDGIQSSFRNCSDPEPQHNGLYCPGDNQRTRSCIIKNCSIDGGWNSWNQWGTCSTSCGVGNQTRHRKCTNPLPMFGGQDCVGNNSTVRECNVRDCPINGSWSVWAPWTDCSTTCGGGVQNRTRACTNPTPKFGGWNCSGNNSEIRICGLINCPVNGGWGPWIEWGPCSSSCSQGLQTRGRFCDSPEPSFGGNNCSGNYTAVRSCIVKHCPVDGEWASWSNWGECSKSCGAGMQYRFRACVNPAPQYGGRNCSGNDAMTQQCFIKHCPVDGGWTPWSGWGTCSSTCSVGVQVSNRTCTNPAPMYGGQNCSGNNTMSQVCILKHCPVDGKWSAWNNWGECSKTCGSGVRVKNRTCDTPAPEYGGRNCSGNTTMTQSCFVKHCPVDGVWGDWNEWGACSRTCGEGIQVRNRTCNNPVPTYGGRNCSGNNTLTQSCLVAQCSVDGGWGGWSEWSACSTTCGAGVRVSDRTCNNPAPAYGGRNCSGNDNAAKFCNVIECPVDGGWASWNGWSSCSLSCGTGMQYNTRMCSNPVPAHGGNNCTGNDTVTRACHLTHCAVDGGWASWTGWSSCSVTCGNGGQHRSRTCTNPEPAYGGANCSWNNTATQPCFHQHCPVNGGWNTWTGWGACNATCGGGVQVRNRTCNKPEPQHNGSDCAGDGSGSRRCNLHNCPVDGGWNTWGSWFDCTVTCGGGYQLRNRTCTNPIPAHNGEDCKGPKVGYRDCNTNNCPVNGGWNQWSDWSHCSTSCGGGYQTTSRNCTDPAPAFGGGFCSGEDTRNQTCNSHRCPVDGGWNAWSGWSNCSQECGGGQQHRSRACNQPSPAHGGKVCDGHPLAIRECNTHNCSVDGGWNDWSTWNPCTVSCGGGHQTRNRTCTPPLFGGMECEGSNVSTQICNIGSCPVDGGWTHWTTWASCSVSCGAGQISRSRYCTNPQPAHDGKDCDGAGVQTAACNPHMCPVDGGWTEWSTWTVCSLTCGRGEKARNRTCSQPVPQFNGTDCQGNSIESRECNSHMCPVNGGWSSWSRWSACTLTCGSGQKTQTRTCTQPPPQYAGKECDGNDLNSTECNTQACLDGWGEWSAWSPCSESCNGGYRIRQKECHSQCEGVGNETETCNTRGCPVNGQWGKWSGWSKCSQTCGKGEQHRLRRCDDPSTSSGGTDCKGGNIEKQECIIEKLCEKKAIAGDFDKSQASAEDKTVMMIALSSTAGVVFVALIVIAACIVFARRNSRKRKNALRARSEFEDYASHNPTYDSMFDNAGAHSEENVYDYINNPAGLHETDNIRNQHVVNNYHKPPLGKVSVGALFQPATFSTFTGKRRSMSDELAEQVSLDYHNPTYVYMKPA